MRVGCRILVVHSRGKRDCLNQMVLQVFTGTSGKQFQTKFTPLRMVPSTKKTEGNSFSFKKLKDC